MVTHDEFDVATQRAKDLQATAPRAVTAHYDHKRGRIMIRLSSGLEVAFSPIDGQGLEKATASQLDKIEITPSGFGIHFPKLDADLSLPALLEGFFGSKKWMAARLGAIGGQSKSAAKVSASRVNGQLGGRPKKATAGAR